MQVQTAIMLLSFPTLQNQTLQRKRKQQNKDCLNTRWSPLPFTHTQLYTTLTLTIESSATADVILGMMNYITLLLPAVLSASRR